MTLRRIRTVLATVFFVLITLLLLDFTGTTHAWLGWMARVQLLPAVLAANFAVVAGLALLTLVFGRVYCSVICPLGVLQDIISRLRGKKARLRFTYSRALTWLRLLMLAVLVAALLLGLGSVTALLAPYSTYGRIVSSLLQPLYLLANNGLAAIAEHFESYAFYGVDVWLRSGITLAIAAASLLLLGTLAWRGGRTWCNTVCPVGTVLGYLARFSVLKVRFDRDKCKQCGLCTRSCKASCIDYTTHSVDYTRCVACGNCLTACRHGALTYAGLRRAAASADKGASAEKADTGRRAFLVGTAVLAADAALAQAGKKVDGGLAELVERTPPHRHQPPSPPGSVSANNLAAHCTACQLCVDHCPNGVLRPSGDLATLMQPTMSFERGWCRPECVRCSEVCPTGAIRPITAADKAALQVGHAVWIKENCVVLTDGVACGNCARHCPTGAIMMVPADPDDDLAPMVPAVDASRCIGCGSCEYVCPARPFSAIYVEGHPAHRTV